MKLLFQLLRNELSIFSRGRIALFWTIAFPTLLLIIQMALFGNGPALGPANVGIRDLDNTGTSQAYANFLGQALTRIHSININAEKLTAIPTKKKFDLIVTLPKGMETTIASHESSKLAVSSDVQGAAAMALNAIVRGITDAYNIEAGAVIRQVEVGTAMAGSEEQPLSYSLYAVSGLCVMTILSTGLMGFGVPLVAAREGGLFRQYQLYPAPTVIFLLAWWLSRIVVVLLSSLILLGIATALYKINIPASALDITLALVILTFGSCAFLALGLALAAFSPNVGAATVLCNIVYFPMLFTGNLLMPTGGLPKSIQQALEFLPANALVASLRRTLGGQMDWTLECRTIVILILMTGVLLAVAQHRFKWAPSA